MEASFVAVDAMMNLIIERVKLHPVKLELLFDPVNITEEDYREECGDDDPPPCPFPISDWEMVVLHREKVILKGTQTGNTDTRGGGCGHCGFTLADFVWTIDGGAEGKITLKELAGGVYRLKGSKYDYYYESAPWLEVVSDDGKEMVIKVDFGYGS
jgi:hypothetical protein